MNAGLSKWSSTVHGSACSADTALCESILEPSFLTEGFNFALAGTQALA